MNLRVMDVLRNEARILPEVRCDENSRRRACLELPRLAQFSPIAKVKREPHPPERQRVYAAPSRIAAAPSDWNRRLQRGRGARMNSMRPVRAIPKHIPEAINCTTS